MKLARERGFVLVGVVMLVLALTILGLSLFSLSSYEAQFIGGSLDGEQAFQAAQGGIERAKFALSVLPNDLQQVRNGLPLENVIAAEAWQEQAGELKNSGPIDFDSGKPVLIRVQTTVGSDPDDAHRAKRIVEGQYFPTKPESYYKRLITSEDTVGINPRVNYDPASPPTPRVDMVHLLGGPRINFWQVSNDTARWTANAAEYLPTGVQVRGVPRPEVGDFITTHGGAPAPARVFDNPGYHVSLPGVAGDVAYYHSRDPSPDGHPLYTYHEDDEFRIVVGGCVVWMVDHGFRSEALTRVEKSAGAANACLVIVAGKNGREAAPYDLGGIWFFGGLRSLEVPVILVSDGGIYVEHYNNQVPNADQTTRVNSLSMYGRYVFLTGPLQTYAPMVLTYSQSTMDPLVDFLSSKGALPNTTSSVAKFDLQPGTWRSTQP